MIYEKINLKDFYPQVDKVTTLTIYVPELSHELDLNRKFRPLLVLPGGGYEFVSEREGEPIALRFASYGFACFVLNYPVWPFEFPHVTIEAIAALDYIRNHAEKYHIDPSKMSAIGFSAGGHLCGSLGALRNRPEFLNFLGIKEPLPLEKIILSYAVMSTQPEISHGATAQHISQGRKEYAEMFDLLNQIDSNFPKTFLWTTAEDDCVKPINTTLAAEKIKAAGVPCLLHVFPRGWHGLSLCDHGVFKDQDFDAVDKLKDVRDWVVMAADFLNE